MQYFELGSDTASDEALNALQANTPDAKKLLFAIPKMNNDILTLQREALQKKTKALLPWIDANFRTYAEKHWSREGSASAGNYYDRAAIYYVWWARTGNATYLKRAQRQAATRSATTR